MRYRLKKDVYFSSYMYQVWDSEVGYVVDALNNKEAAKGMIERLNECDREVKARECA